MILCIRLYYLLTQSPKARDASTAIVTVVSLLLLLIKDKIQCVEEIELKPIYNGGVRNDIVARTAEVLIPIRGSSVH